MRPVGWGSDFDDVQQAMIFNGDHVSRLLPNDVQATFEAQCRQRQGKRRAEKFNADAREGLFCLRAAANGCHYRCCRRQAVALFDDDCLRQRFNRCDCAVFDAHGIPAGFIGQGRAACFVVVHFMRFRYYRGVRITRLRGFLDDEIHIRIERLCDALQHLN